jgi:hypothetical protein
MVSEPDLSAALILGVVVPISAADAEVLKQRLNTLVIAVEAAKEKAATMCHRVLAVHQLLDEEQAATADLERRAATKKLIPGSTSFSTTETAIASSSYIDTIVANLHIQADNKMEEIRLDTIGPAAAPTAFYSNKMMSAQLSPPLAPPHPLGKNNCSGPDNGNGSNNNRHRNNKCRDGGSGSKNSDNGGNHGGNTTVVFHGVTTNDGRGPPP